MLALSRLSYDRDSNNYTCTIPIYQTYCDIMLIKNTSQQINCQFDKKKEQCTCILIRCMLGLFTRFLSAADFFFQK